MFQIPFKWQKRRMLRGFEDGRTKIFAFPFKLLCETKMFQNPFGIRPCLQGTGDSQIGKRKLIFGFRVKMFQNPFT